MRSVMTDIGKTVDIYFNLNNGFWSVRHLGKIIGHAEYLVLEPKKFHVGQSGREKVLKTCNKNVHAWIKGDLLSYDKKQPRFGGKEITYNPYMNNDEGFFYFTKTKLECFPEDFDLIYFDFEKRKCYGK